LTLDKSPKVSVLEDESPQRRYNSTKFANEIIHPRDKIDQIASQTSIRDILPLSTIIVVAGKMKDMKW
jgi:hypothetical protein